MTTTPTISRQSPGASMKDRFGRRLRDIRVSVTDRCNFRCPYCMPAEIYGERYEFLPRPEILTFEEIERLARLFGSLGASKLRITGGEPLVRAKLPNLIERLAAIETVDDLTLTTNGFLLAKMAQSLKDAGLQRVTVSLDSLDPDTFSKMAGRNYGPERVLEGIEAAERRRPEPDKDQLRRAARRKRRRRREPRQSLQGHRPHRAVHRVHGRRQPQRLEPQPGRYSQRNHRSHKRRIPSRTHPVELPGRSGKPLPLLGRLRRNRRHRLRVGAVLRRLHSGRLSTDGRFVTCLFASGGKDLKTPMRSGATDEELLQIISGVWERRTDRYSEERAANTDFEGNVTLPRQKIEMFQIGG